MMAQYQDKQQMFIPGGHGKHSDPVAALAIKREQLQNKCKILEKAAERGEDKPVKQ